MSRSLPLFTFLLLVHSFSGWAQGVMEGRVVDDSNGEPIPGAVVQVHPPERSVITNEIGFFSFTNLPPGKLHFHFLAPGYEAWEGSFDTKNANYLIIRLKPTFIELKEIVVEDATFSEGTRKSSLTTVAIDDEQLKDPSQNTFAEALAKTPGVDFINTGVGIAKPVIRGMTGVRIQVNNQGIKQEGQQWGLDHGLEVDPFSVERVEVVKGAAALQFGAEATGGVIRILPDPVPIETFSGRVSGIYRSNNQHIGTGLKISSRKGRFFSIGRFSRSSWNDYRVPSDEFLYNGVYLPIVDRTLKNTAGSEISAGLVTGWIGDRSTIRLNTSWWNQRSGLFSGATGIPRYFDIIDLGSTSDIDLPRQDNSHWRASLDGQHGLWDGWLKWDLGIQYNERREESDPKSHGLQYIGSEDSLALRLDLLTVSFSPHYRISRGRWDITSGFDLQFQNNTKSGWEYLLPDFKRYSESIYSVTRYSVNEKLSITGGVRFEWVQVNSQEHYQPYYNDPDSAVLRSPVIDKNWSNLALSLGVSKQFAQTWVARYNLSRTFRIPQVVELAGNGVHHGTFRHEVGNPDLEPERGWQLDLSVEGEGKNWFTRIGGYGYWFSNYIYLSPSGRFSPLPDAGQLYVYRQDEVFYMGVEALVEYHPLKQIHLSTQISYVNTINLNSGYSLPFTPPLNGLVSASFDFPLDRNDRWKGSFNISTEWASDQDRVDRNEMPTPGYILYHAGIQIGRDWKGWGIQLNLQAKNIWDTPYLKHLSRYRLLNLSEQGRNLAVGLTVHF
ncbi:MAG: TonB-dependent receptor [Bacteroidota bacterium]|nr:TonB-dependent receptor [Bacteroidota bacterium]MDX5449178.1 TonB-dependent receptor [Bacteroidota bacterium]